MAPHVNLLVDINTGNDEEDSRTPGSSCQEPAQPEDDGPLVLLCGNYLIIRSLTSDRNTILLIMKISRTEVWGNTIHNRFYFRASTGFGTERK